jgi:hypothetical protein
MKHHVKMVKYNTEAIVKPKRKRLSNYQEPNNKSNLLSKIRALLSLIKNK